MKKITLSFWVLHKQINTSTKQLLEAPYDLNAGSAATNQKEKKKDEKDDGF